MSQQQSKTTSDGCLSLLMCPTMELRCSAYIFDTSSRLPLRAVSSLTHRTQRKERMHFTLCAFHSLRRQAGNRPLSAKGYGCTVYSIYRKVDSLGDFLEFAHSLRWLLIVRSSTTYAAGESIFCRERWRRGSSQMTLEEDLLL